MYLRKTSTLGSWALFYGGCKIQRDWQKRLSDMLQAGNIPLPGVVLAPLGAGAVYDALNDR
jgi:hypothetical protein